MNNNLLIFTMLLCFIGKMQSQLKSPTHICTKNQIKIDNYRVDI